MVLDIKGELRLTQKLVLSPRLRQSLELLQLAKLDLEQRIKEELEVNPLLEVEEEEPIRKDVPLPNEGGNSRVFAEGVDWDVLYDNLFHSSRSWTTDEDKPSIEDTLSSSTTLRDYLVEQLYMHGLEDEDIDIGIRIIGNIDDDGILRVPLESVFQGRDLDRARRVLAIIQKFDPPGVGGRSISEVLLIQAKERGFPEEVIRFIEEFGPYIDGGDARSFLKEIERRKDGKAMLSWLSLLDPKPGLRCPSSETTYYVVPDVLVFELDGRFEVALNREGLPSLKINRRYLKLMRGGVDRLTEEFIRSKMRSALSFMKMLEQRESTLLAVARSIVRFQEGFLRRGEEAFRPLTLGDVAGDVGIHESTVSRVVSNKYMSTPRGTFPMKFFFGGGLAKDGMGSVSTRAVKNMIAEIIEGEDKVHPLSDSEIQRILLERGIRIARRTVAKYREAMGIPSKDLRRLKK